MLLVYSSIGGHLGCFYILATVNDATRVRIKKKTQHIFSKTNLWARGWNYGEILLPFPHYTEFNFKMY